MALVIGPRPHITGAVCCGGSQDSCYVQSPCCISPPLPRGQSDPPCPPTGAAGMYFCCCHQTAKLPLLPCKPTPSLATVEPKPHPLPPYERHKPQPHTSLLILPRHCCSGNPSLPLQHPVSLLGCLQSCCLALNTPAATTAAEVIGWAVGQKPADHTFNILRAIYGLWVTRWTALL